MKKIYFAGSIRGGRIDAELYERLIKYMQKDNIVLTEHIGSPHLTYTIKIQPGCAKAIS